MILSIWFVIFAILLILIGSVYLAIIYLDPHWINRGGAFLAAVAAAFAILEASLENRIKNEKSQEEKDHQHKNNFSDFISITATRIRHARFRQANSKLSSEKLKTVFFSSMIAIIGELLHGFGDLLFKFTLSILN